ARGNRRPAVRRIPHPDRRQALLQHDAARPRRHRHAARPGDARPRHRHLGRRLDVQGQRHPAVLPVRAAGEPVAADLQAVARPGVRLRARRPPRDERVARRPWPPARHFRREGVLDRREPARLDARGEGSRAPVDEHEDRRADHGRGSLGPVDADRAGGRVGPLRPGLPRRAERRGDRRPGRAPPAREQRRRAARTRHLRPDREPRDRGEEPRDLRGAGYGAPPRRVRAAPERDPQRGHARPLRDRGPAPRPAPLRGPLVRAAGADAPRGAAALGRRGRHRRGDDRAAARRGLHDPRHVRPGALLRPRAAVDGAEQHDLHRGRPDRPARRPAQRHHRHAAHARRAAAAPPRPACDAAVRPPRAGARVTLWSGRVEGSLAPEVWDFLRADDAELLPYDVEGTRITVRRLHAAGLLSDGELAEVDRLLDRVGPPDASDEDVHSAIERQLGAVGRRIHAGRSRNDQVAAALRLYVADACTEAIAAIEEFARVILQRAEAEADTPMPGYTHLQRAQPVTAGHHLLAWVEMLDRDRDRFRFAAERARPSPLGAGARAGSTLQLPPPPEPTRNSLDAVADRDFALDYLYACAVLHSHLSRIGEELCLWTTSEFGFARLPETAATGSSMMPQKLNPDVAELARGKAGTALGRLTGLLAVVKGLPLAYDRELQE